MRWAVLALVAAVFAAGCSVKPGESGAVAVRLVPQARPFELWSILSAALPSTLTDLNCFGVAARGAKVGATNSCDALKALSTSDAFAAGIDSTFRLLVPLDSETTLEAFGYSGSCARATDAVLGANTLYKIGSLGLGDLKIGEEIKVPVGFDATQVFKCATTPYTLLTETFPYSPGPLTTSTTNWVISGGTTLTQGTNVIAFSASTSYAFLASTAAVRTDKPYFAIDLDINVAVGIVGYSISTGVASAVGPGANPSAACEVTLQSNTTGGSVHLGATATGLHPATGTTVMSYSNTIHLKCEFQRAADGTFTMRESINGTPLVTLTGVTDPCAATSCQNRLYLSSLASGGPTATADNLVLTAADSAQF